MKKTVLIFVIASLFVLVLKQKLFSFFSPKKYCVLQTGLLSDDYFSVIKKNAEQLLESNCSAQNLIAYLTNEFPVLNKIVIAYYPHGVYAKVCTDEPICCINDELVLTDQHTMYPKHFFAHYALSRIGCITVTPDYLPKVTSCITSLLRELPSHFYEAYDLELCDEHTVRLINKEEKKFITVLSANQKNISRLLSYCETIKERICEQKNYDVKSTWICDTRFSDYIVAYRSS